MRAHLLVLAHALGRYREGEHTSSLDDQAMDTPRRSLAAGLAHSTARRVRESWAGALNRTGLIDWVVPQLAAACEGVEAAGVDGQLLAAVDAGNTDCVEHLARWKGVSRRAKAEALNQAVVANQADAARVLAKSPFIKGEEKIAALQLALQYVKGAVGHDEQARTTLAAHLAAAPEVAQWASARLLKAFNRIGRQAIQLIPGGTRLSLTVQRDRNKFEVVRDGLVDWPAFLSPSWYAYAHWDSNVLNVSYTGEAGGEAGQDVGGLSRELYVQALLDVRKLGMLEEEDGVLRPRLPGPEPGVGKEAKVCHPVAGWLEKKVRACTRQPLKNSTDKFHIDTASYRALGALLGTAMVSDEYVTELPLHEAVYKELLAAPPPAARSDGEIASCERLMPFFGNSWWYVLGADGKRGFEHTPEMFEWGPVDPSNHKKDEGTTEGTIREWAEKACRFLWTTYLAPQLEPMAEGFEHVLGAAVGVNKRLPVKTFADKDALAAARAVPSLLAFRIEGPREVDLEGLLKATTCEDCSPAELATYGAAVRAAAAADADFPAGLLAFVTSLRTMPARFTFKVNKIRDRGACGTRLPMAHTCFNSLDVADTCFRNAAKLQHVLEQSVKLGQDAGFGIA
jgi:hypothetical protein